jgi:rare lipoprotein A
MCYKKRFFSVTVPLLLILFLSSCSHYQYFSSGNEQVGLASWYGKDFHGKKTANAETYDMYAMTAAHKTLPFGSIVLVHNLKNKKSVKVRINDRGPFVKGRIIDLSYSAAKAIGLIGPGVVPVRIEIVRSVSPKGPLKYAIQVGAFVERKNALKLKRALQYKYRNTYISQYKPLNSPYFRVRIPVDSQKQAARIIRFLEKKGFSPFLLEVSNFK